MKWLFTASQILILLAATASESPVTPGALKGIKSYDPLQDSYLVVRGTVREVVPEKVNSADWDLAEWPARNTRSYMDVLSIKLSVTGVLKGELNQKDIVLKLRDIRVALEHSLLAPGDDVIVCPRWRNTKSGPLLVINPYRGIYVTKGGTQWVKLPFDPELEQAETLTYAEILSRIRQSSLENVTAASDVIVRGVVVSKWETDYRSDDGRLGVMTHYRVRVSDLLKGSASGEFVEFVIPRVKEYVPQWYREVPLGIDVGQEWLVFLRKGERGLYPFAGPSGVLQIEGDDLIFNESVKYPHTLPEATRIIRSEVSDE